MRAILLLLIAPGALFGRIANFTVVGTTPTQAVLRFAVPDPAQCTIVVYEDAAHTVVAHDTDATLFAGAASCNRPGNIVSGQNVTAMLGGRTIMTALDGKAYSRALEEDKTYWVTITDTANSSPYSSQFTTTRIPFGQTWNDPLAPIQPWISPTDATQTIIDPHTGARLHRLTLANDITSQQGLTFGAPGSGAGLERRREYSGGRRSGSDGFGVDLGHFRSGHGREHRREWGHARKDVGSRRRLRPECAECHRERVVFEQFLRRGGIGRSSVAGSAVGGWRHHGGDELARYSDIAVLGELHLGEPADSRRYQPITGGLDFGSAARVRCKSASCPQW